MSVRRKYEDYSCWEYSSKEHTEALSAIATLQDIREMAKDINPADLSLGFGVFVRNLQALLGIEPQESGEND